MKYMCFGYIKPGTFEGMTEDDRHAVLDECVEDNDHLHANGHLENGEDRHNQVENWDKNVGPSKATKP